MNHAVTSHTKKVIYIPGRCVFINVCVLIYIVNRYTLYHLIYGIYEARRLSGFLGLVKLCAHTLGRAQGHGKILNRFIYCRGWS